MRKLPSVGELRERVKAFEVLVVVSAALFGLTAIELVSSWSSRPDLARRDIVILNANFGLILAGSILTLVLIGRQLGSVAGTK